MSVRIGVLALQGAFIEHEKMFRRLGAETFELRAAKDLDCRFDGLVIPGGESTVQGKLLRELGMFERIKDAIGSGLPVFGTCAGLLLLAKNIENDSRTHLATMDITAVRNAYGRQLGSFGAVGMFDGVELPMTFIRAPYIRSVDGDARALASVDGKIVAARQGSQLVTAFHPELTESAYIHQYFIDMITGAK